MTTRNGSADWHGDVQTGSGTITAGDGVFQGPHSYDSRFGEHQGTNPEPLIAAAQAGCFTMALANKVKGIDEQQFVGYAEDAKATCPVARALSGIPEIVLNATLIEGA